MKRAHLSGLALVAGLVMLLGIAYQQYTAFLEQALDLPRAGASIQVNRGAAVRSVLLELQASGYTDLDWRWRLLTRLHPVTIQAGEYALDEGIKPEQLLSLLASGAVIQYRFTIIEGWTYLQLRAALLANEVLLHVEGDLDGDSVMERLLGQPGHPEGMFLPETYAFVRGDTDLDVLRRAHEALQEELAEAWEKRDTGLPLDEAYELLILASVVEKESSLKSERPAIAGVFVRRLLQRWRLETDPAVIYGLGDTFDGDIHARDLQTDTPYNTYIHYGLPPTPIAMAGKSALRAAARPEQGAAMFFVADGKGGHVFSDTLTQHNAAVKQLLKRSKQP